MSQNILTDVDARLNAQLARPQLSSDGGIRHFLGVEGLNRAQLESIIDKAMGYFDANDKLINTDELSGRTVMNLFFENSTRTRTTFEAAQKRLGANVLNLDIARSSTNKGETLRDTLWNLEAMSADMFVVRHGASGAAHFMATQVTPMQMITLSYADAFIKTIQIHPLSASIEMLRACALSHGITLDMGDDHQGWLDLLFSHLVEPTLGFGAPTLITDYPPATASLAKMSVDADGHQVAKRFELYINGIEIANAYDELADGKALRQRFEQDNAQRTALGLPIMPIDEHLLAACDELPECSGIALGVDRLFMVVAGLTDISQSIAIMTERA